MNMNTNEKLKTMLCTEMDKIASKGELNTSTLETLNKLTDTHKNIEKMEMLEEEMGYSQAGEWEAHGNSYGGRRRDSMGRYSRNAYPNRMMYPMDGGSSYGGNYSMNGNYSQGGGKEHMMREMEEAMAMASSEKEREIIRNAMNSLR